MESYLAYAAVLQELRTLKRKIEEIEADREVPSKLQNLVTYATEEAAIRLQDAEAPPASSPESRKAA